MPPRPPTTASAAMPLSGFSSAPAPPVCGSTHFLPSSGDVQYLYVVCGLATELPPNVTAAGPRQTRPTGPKVGTVGFGRVPHRLCRRVNTRRKRRTGENRHGCRGSGGTKMMGNMVPKPNIERHEAGASFREKTGDLHVTRLGDDGMEEDVDIYTEPFDGYARWRG